MKLIVPRIYIFPKTLYHDKLVKSMFQLSGVQFILVLCNSFDDSVHVRTIHQDFRQLFDGISKENHCEKIITIEVSLHSWRRCQ